MTIRKGKASPAPQWMRLDDAAQDMFAVPVIAAGGPLAINNFQSTFSFEEDALPIFLDGDRNASVIDPDNEGFAGGHLRVSITSDEAAAEDVVGIVNGGAVAVSGVVPGSSVAVNGIVIGIIEGGGSGIGGEDLVIGLNAAADAAKIGILLRSLSYLNVNHTRPALDTRGIAVTLDNGRGGPGDSISVTTNGQISPRNDTPALSEPDTGLVNYTVQGPPVPLFAGVTLTDPDNPANFVTGQLNINGGGFGGGVSLIGPRFVVNFYDIMDTTTNQKVGTNGSGDPNNIGQIHLTTAATLEVVNALIQSLGYSVAGANPTTTPRSVSMDFLDGGGWSMSGGNKLSNIVAQTVTIGGEVNVRPQIYLGGFAQQFSVADDNFYVAGTAGIRLGEPGLGIIEPNEQAGDRIESMTLTLINPQAGDQLAYGALPPGIAAAITTPFGRIVLTFTGTATTAVYEMLLHDVRFSNPDANTSTVTRTIQVEASDGELSSFAADARINVWAPNNIPIARDDLFFTGAATMLAGEVFPDNGSGRDTDNDGPGLYVGAVNGSAAGVGHQIVLSSGALLTLLSNGHFVYDPNGAFTTTPAPGSGASNAPAIDSFTYTLLGGGTATVTLAVSGLDSNGDILLGSAGADALNGGIGADAMTGLGGHDLYIVDNGGDTAIEAAGGGSDIVYSAVSYTLAADSEVENLSTITWENNDPLNLTGNALNNTLIGNAGNNQLDGRGGSDVMIGREGGDIYLVDGLGDQVIEAAGQGYDVIYTSGHHVLAAGSSVEGLSTITWEATNSINLGGNAADNYLIGNAGTNALDGKGGNDVLQGREGADRFGFTTALGANNVDFIFDFEAGVDRIALDDAIFNALPLGALNPGAFVTGTAAQDTNDRIVYNPATGALYYDADGSGLGAAIQFATLQAGLSLNASDFQIL